MGSEGAGVLLGSQCLRGIRNGVGGEDGVLGVLPPQVPVDGWQSPPQARSPRVCLQKESMGLGQSKLDPCGWGVGGEIRDVENPGDSSASMLLHHLTPSIQGLPRPSCRERTESRDPRRRSCGGREGREGQDEGGEQGVFQPRDTGRNRRPAEQSHLWVR